MKKVFTSSSLWSCLIALVMMMASQSAWAEYVKLTALSGSKNLSDAEGCAKLVDASTPTKWGQSFDPNSEDAGRKYAWVVVKAEKAVIPQWYFLVTGNDTGNENNHGRNWKEWNMNWALHFITFQGVFGIAFAKAFMANTINYQRLSIMY